MLVTNTYKTFLEELSRSFCGEQKKAPFALPNCRQLGIVGNSVKSSFHCFIPLIYYEIEMFYNNMKRQSLFQGKESLQICTQTSHLSCKPAYQSRSFTIIRKPTCHRRFTASPSCWSVWSPCPPIYFSSKYSKSSSPSHHHCDLSPKGLT